VDLALFPPAVACVTATYDESGDPGTFGVVLPPAIERAVPKRRIEFAAGRWCAREALRTLDDKVASVDVGIGAQREPLFPPGVVGAITHGGGLAAAAVAWARDMRGVGIDVAPWIADDALASVEQTVLVPGEGDRLCGQTGWSRARVATVVFSAKETLFKCLVPTVGRYFDFTDAEIVSLDNACFTARVRVSLARDILAGAVFEGRLRLAEAHVMTGMAWETGRVP
jgi:enterobactin synthetase component D